MRLRLSLPNLAKVNKQILRELIKKVDRIFRDSLPDIELETKAVTQQLMYKSKFFNEVLFGNLQGHFGIPENKVNDAVKTIITEITASIEVFYNNLTLTGNSVRGGIKIGIGKNGFSSLLSLAEGQVNAGKNGKPIKLPWLEWVMTRGDQIIISEHDIKFEQGLGRSGFAIMVPDKLVSWRVPSEFSGTIQDNVITREILHNLEVYSRTVSRIINKHVKSNIS